MEVILIERMQNLGNIGDVVKVKDGYARNFLLPQKKVLRATKDNIAYFETKRAEIEKRNADSRKEAEKVAKGLEGEVVTLIRAASDDGRLYGSVNARDVAQALKDKKHEVSRKVIELGAVIKEIGIYTIQVALHPEVIVPVKINVARSESEAEAALKGKGSKKAEQADKSLTEEAVGQIEAEEKAAVAETEEAEAEVVAEADVSEEENMAEKAS